LRWRAKAAGEILASIEGSNEPSRSVAGAALNLRLIVWVGNRVSVAGKEFLRDGLASRHDTPYVGVIAMGPMKSSAKTWGHVVSSFITCGTCKVTWNLTWRARACLRFKSFSSAPACWDACEPVHIYSEPAYAGIWHSILRLMRLVTLRQLSIVLRYVFLRVATSVRVAKGRGQNILELLWLTLACPFAVGIYVHSHTHSHICSY
jgi:hypothetical protein